MNKLRRFWFVLGVVAALAVIAAATLPASKVGATLPQSASPASKPAAAAGMKVYIDPATGRMGPPPAPAAPDRAAEAMFSSSHEGLVEEPGTTPAGGFKVDARGRFRHAVMLRAGSDGRLGMSCGEDNKAHPAGQ